MKFVSKGVEMSPDRKKRKGKLHLFKEEYLVRLRNNIPFFPVFCHLII